VLSCADGELLVLVELVVLTRSLLRIVSRRRGSSGPGGWSYGGDAALPPGVRGQRVVRG